jgi:hypothetical protein
MNLQSKSSRNVFVKKTWCYERKCIVPVKVPAYEFYSYLIRTTIVREHVGDDLYERLLSVGQAAEVLAGQRALLF